MAEIVALTDREPNPALVAMLEELLASAKAGELRSLIYASAVADNGTGHGVQLDVRTWWQPLIAEVAMLQHKMVEKIILDRESA